MGLFRIHKVAFKTFQDLSLVESSDFFHQWILRPVANWYLIQFLVNVCEAGLFNASSECVDCVARLPNLRTDRSKLFAPLPQDRVWFTGIIVGLPAGEKLAHARESRCGVRWLT